MSSRIYGQACSVSNFLDHLGSRWTLLIVRDLMIGPRRFKELLAGLPGIGTNLLTSRLSELQVQDIIEKRTDPATGSPVYVLTSKGKDLEPVVLAMARWGLEYLQSGKKNRGSRPDLLVVAFRAVFQPDRATGVNETYELRIGDVIFYASVRHRQLETGLGPAQKPAMVYSTDTSTFDQIVAGSLDEKDARRRGLLHIMGEKAAYRRFLDAFGSKRVKTV